VKPRSSHKPNSYGEDRQGNLITFLSRICSDDKKLKANEKERKGKSSLWNGECPSLH